jgi:serine/threonine protein kinase
MACVWAARLTGYRGFSKLVAIKTVLPHLAGHHDFESMLLDEARIAAQAHHPNVCNLFDVGEQDGILYLVLEWVEGDSLLQLLRAARTGAAPALDYRIAARIVADACAGLHAAHELVDEQGVPLGVVHRDVSPHNLLVSTDGTTKLADFGVAKAQGQLHQATLAGEIRGKLAYMAPEQMNGSGLDRRADVFAMGGVLYHATTGHAPFRGESDARLIRAVLDGEYEAPDQVAPDYPAALAAIVTRALSPDPGRRFETAERMQNALEVWLSTTGTPTTPNDVSVALEAERVSGSTRPVRAPAVPLDSGTLRATHSPADASSHPRSFDGAPLRLLPPGPDNQFTAERARRGSSLKMAGAVALGLLTAAVLLSFRSLVERRDDPRPLAPFLSAVAATAAAPAILTASSPAPNPSAPVPSFVRPASGIDSAPLPSAPLVPLAPSSPVATSATRNAPPPNRAPGLFGGLALPANPY